jgi:hypothetical protein
MTDALSSRKSMGVIIAGWRNVFQKLALAGIASRTIPSTSPDAREFGVPARLSKLADAINRVIPQHALWKLNEALDRIAEESLGSSRILVRGVAYKRMCRSCERGAMKFEINFAAAAKSSDAQQRIPKHSRR